MITMIIRLEGADNDNRRSGHVTRPIALRAERPGRLVCKINAINLSQLVYVSGSGS